MRPSREPLRSPSVTLRPPPVFPRPPRGVPAAVAGRPAAAPEVSATVERRRAPSSESSGEEPGSLPSVTCRLPAYHPGLRQVGYHELRPVVRGAVVARVEAHVVVARVVVVVEREVDAELRRSVRLIAAA